MSLSEAEPSTFMELVTRLTEQAFTPGTLETAFSTCETHAEHVIPSTSNCLICVICYCPAAVPSCCENTKYTSIRNAPRQVCNPVAAAVLLSYVLEERLRAVQLVVDHGGGRHLGADFRGGLRDQPTMSGSRSTLSNLPGRKRIPAPMGKGSRRRRPDARPTRRRTSCRTPPRRPRDS